MRRGLPESRRCFLASGNAIRSPDGTFWRQEMRSGVPTALFGVRKCNPGSRQPFPAYPKDKKMSMGKGFSKNKIHSLCVPRYTPLLFSTDLAAGETIGLTNAVHICEQTGGRTHVTQGCFFFMEKVLRVNQFFRQKMKSEKNNGNHHSTAKPSYAKWMPWGIRRDSSAWGAMS